MVVIVIVVVVMVMVMVVIAALRHDDATAQCTPEGDSQQHQRENSFHDVAFLLRLIELY
jgi:hypothetical protein